MSLKIIKNKIRSIDKTRKVTKAMGAVSAVKMRKSQERALTSRPYAKSALTILTRVSGCLEGRNHPLSEKREEKKICLGVITSDKGLAGSLNSAVLKNAIRIIKERNYKNKQMHIISVGRKAKDFFNSRGFNVVKSYENISDSIHTKDMREITDNLIVSYTKKEYDKVYIVYTQFLSTFEQTAVVRRLLPLSVPALFETVESIKPRHGKFSNESREEDRNINEYTVEPSPDEVFDELLPFLLNIEVYHALVESKASEHSARMVAMKNASDKAEEMSDELNLKYNKARQGSITREVSEIIGGMEAMKD